jgi:hypothetical protein
MYGDKWNNLSLRRLYAERGDLFDWHPHVVLP